MTNREFFLQTFGQEQAIFERVLKAVNQDKWNYRPDPITKTGKDIVAVITNEPAELAEILNQGAADFTGGYAKKPETINEAINKLDAGFENVKKAVVGVSEDDWGHKEVLLKSPGGDWKTKICDMAWGFLLDMIHHRGQLSTYIRPMGGKVPSIYGPSADSKE